MQDNPKLEEEYKDLELKEEYKDFEMLEVEVGDIVSKQYDDGVEICEVIGIHEEYEKTYEINVLFTSTRPKATKERDESEFPLWTQFPDYNSEIMTDLR